MTSKLPNYTDNVESNPWIDVKKELPTSVEAIGGEYEVLFYHPETEEMDTSHAHLETGTDAQGRFIRYWQNPYHPGLIPNVTHYRRWE